MLKRALLLILLFTCVAADAQLADMSKAYTINSRKTALPVTIDGNIDEDIWKAVEPAKDFWMVFPYDSSAAKTKTEVFTCYDENNLYFAAVCYDEFPDKPYVVTSLKRDYSGVSDFLGIYVDPFGDGTNGFEFGVNPLGVQREGLISYGSDWSFDWDNKWYSQVKRYADRWVVEIAIPFKILRFKQGAAAWKINFGRVDLKRNEKSSWVPVPRIFALRSLAFTGSLVFSEPLEVSGNKLAVIPYVTGGVSKDKVENTPIKYSGNVGVDAKVAITSSLNLDLTVNPDFSQVEVDQQVTNLSRFELFFPEKRQFFIENSDLFSRFGFTQIRPFFSRRIGVGRDPYTGQFKQNTIYGGARLSGRINKNWRVGAMSMQTARDNSINLPGANYSVAAVQRQVFSRSNIAAIFVNEQLMDDSTGAFRFDPSKYNRVAGLDYNLASKDNKWSGKFFYHQSLQPNQPKDAYTHASYLAYDTRKFNFMWNHEFVGENYRAQVGYVPRRNYWRLEPGIGYNIYPKRNKHVNYYEFYLYASLYMDHKFERTLDLSNRFIFNTFFQNTSYINVVVDRSYLYLFSPFDPTNTDGLELPAGTSYTYYNGGVEYHSDTRQKFTYWAGFTYGQYFNGQIYSVGGSMGYRFQPYGTVSISTDYYRIALPKPYATTDILLVGPRFDLSFSKTMFLTAFFQYNNQIKNLNSNIRFQWRFRPVSDLFIVYGDNYFSDNLHIKNRALVVKLTYWFNV
jgi:hypothetical protein